MRGSTRALDAVPLPLARGLSHAVREARADESSRRAAVTSLNGIAAALDERRVPTPAGSQYWHAAQVSRVLRRLAS